MSETTDKSGYDKLSPQRKKIADMLLANLESGAGVWKQGWRSGGAPENAITGKQYRGVNNLFLLLVSMERGYKDNRWLTFNQMKAREWSFKTDEAGRSLGKNAGVPVEFFDLWDRETHNKFDRAVLDGLSADERQTYMDENVYPIRRYYTVFNADLIDGIPAKEERVLDESAKTERAERMISNWSENESKIVYGGSQAYYSKASDEIHLPVRGDFYDLQEFYATALHEIGHSTGHAKRLSRDLSGKFGSPEYAMEELRAEIASVFLEQDFGVEVDESAVRNNRAYIQHWKDVIRKDPNALFTAIADADKISKYILQKEAELSREIEPYAVSEEEDETGDLKYRVYMVSGYGQIRAVPLSGDDRESVMQDFEKIQRLPYWSGKRFKEVSMDELQAESISRAEMQAEDENAEPASVTEEKSEVFMLPSVAAALAASAKDEKREQDNAPRGKESLTRMDDREIVERAERSKGGEKFTQLYNGISVTGDEEKDERSLMTRFALFTDDKAQLMRLFRSSAQYRDEKPNAYFEKLADESVAFVSKLKANMLAASMSGGNRTRFGLNAKT